MFRKTLSLFTLTFITILQAFFHLFRFLWDIPMTVGSVLLPGWTGGLAFIAFGLLASWALQTLFTLPRLPRA